MAPPTTKEGTPQPSTPLPNPQYAGTSQEALSGVKLTPPQAIAMPPIGHMHAFTLVHNSRPRGVSRSGLQFSAFLVAQALIYLKVLFYMIARKYSQQKAMRLLASIEYASPAEVHVLADSHLPGHSIPSLARSHR